MLLAFLASRVTGRSFFPDNEQIAFSIGAIAAALLFYGTAFAGMDISEPLVLTPLVVSACGIALAHRYFATATSLLLAAACYYSGLIESQNFWHYLVDPVLLLFSLVIAWRQRGHLSGVRISDTSWQRGALIVIAVFLAWSVYLASADPDTFRNRFVIEDGFVEWVTVVILFTTMIVCLKRLVQLRPHRPPLFLSVTFLLAAFCLFGAGEEISWGQRIFGLETPEYFEENNSQGEIGLHNLVVVIDGEEVKLNKLIFGTGLALALLIYLFVATPLYRRKEPVRRFFNALAAPMPRNYQVIGYLAVVATVELLIDHSKRGEMTEFAGSIMFALNVIFPDNEALFDKSRTLEQINAGDSTG